MNRIVFDSIPLDDLIPGERYLIERYGDVGIAGCFAGFHSRRGRPLVLVVALIGGEYRTIAANEIDSIKRLER